MVELQSSFGQVEIPVATSWCMLRKNNAFVNEMHVNEVLNKYCLDHDHFAHACLSHTQAYTRSQIATEGQVQTGKSLISLRVWM